MSIPTHPSQFVDSSQFEESLRVEDGFRDDVESIINSEDTNALYRENSSSIRLEEKRFFKGMIIMLPLAVLFWIMIGWLI